MWFDVIVRFFFYFLFLSFLFVPSLSCAVSDSLVLHIGGNPGVHGISVSNSMLKLNVYCNSSYSISYSISLLSNFSALGKSLIDVYKRRSL